MLKTETNKSALALFRRFRPHFREMMWEYTGLLLVKSEEFESGHFERTTLRTFTRCNKGMCFRPAHNMYGSCDGGLVNPLEDELLQEWRSAERDPPPPYGGGRRDELFFDLRQTGNLRLPPFQCEPNRSKGPIVQFELFLAQQIVKLLAELKFRLDVAEKPKKASGDEETSGLSPLEQRQFTGVISWEGKLPKGFTIKSREIPSQSWKFFVPTKSIEGQAIQAAIELEKPGKISDLKAIEKKLLGLLELANEPEPQEPAERPRRNRNFSRE